MAQIDDLIAQAAAENAVIGQLATAVKSLADGYVALEDKYNALVLQGTEVTAITAEQFKTFGDDIATGKQQAQDALTSALNALNPPAAATSPETPADPNPATGSGTDAGSTDSGVPQQPADATNG